MSSYPKSTTLPPDAPSFGERYQVIKKLGSGGMGAVYQAVDSALEKTVAVKILLPGLSSETIIRFQQEAKAAARLDHPNIVKVLDFGQTQNGDLFLIMDFVGSTSLEDIINQEKRIALDRALPIFIQIAAGLKHAHDNDILHRDIKPSNVMISEKQEGNVQIVDFGLAKLQSADDSQKLTTTGTHVGSPLYMSPEQAGGIETDVRADIYSLGCLMYRTLTGTPPLKGDTLFDTIQMHRNAVPLLLNETDCGVDFSVEIEELVAKSLEKDPKNRFQSADELLSALIELQELNRVRLSLGANFRTLDHDPHHLGDDRISLPFSRFAKKLNVFTNLFFANRRVVSLIAFLFFSAGWLLYCCWQNILTESKDLKIKESESPEFMGEATARIMQAPESERKSWSGNPSESRVQAEKMVEEIRTTPSMKKFAQDPALVAAIRSGKFHRLKKDQQVRKLFRSRDMITLSPKMSWLWTDAKFASLWTDPVVRDWLSRPALWKNWSSKPGSRAAKFSKNKTLRNLMSDSRFLELLDDRRFQNLMVDKTFQRFAVDPINFKLMSCIEAYRDQMRLDAAELLCPIQSDLNKDE